MCTCAHAHMSESSGVSSRALYTFFFAPVKARLTQALEDGDTDVSELKNVHIY